MGQFSEQIEKFEPFWGVWRLDALLGEGAYGKVYRVVHRGPMGRDQYAALKWISLPQDLGEVRQLRAEGTDEPSIRSYYTELAHELWQEIELMSRLRGTSHIVSFEDHLLIERQDAIGWDLFIRMELLTPLSDVLQQRPMDGHEVVKLGVHLCEALELCGRYHIIHRDIKPANIFLSDHGDYKLGDFGVARQMEKTTGALSRKGTPHYMAPEVYFSKPYDATVDLYSLGMVLYQLLNRQRVPFAPAGTALLSYSQREEAFQRRLAGEALPPPEFGNDALRQVVLRACAFAPGDRFADATQMRKALLAAGEQPGLEATVFAPRGDAALRRAPSASEGSGAPTPSVPVERPAPQERTQYAPLPQEPPKPAPRKGRRWLPGVIAACVLLLCVGIGAWFLLGNQSEAEPLALHTLMPAATSPEATAVSIRPPETPEPTEAVTRSPTEAPTATPTEVPAPQLGGDVVAVVGNRVITREEAEPLVRDYQESMVYYYSLLGLGDYDTTDEKNQREVARQVLENWARHYVLEDKARALGFWGNDPTLQQALEAEAATQYQGYVESGLENTSQEEVYRQLLSAILEERLFAYATQHVRVTEDEARDAYAAEAEADRARYAEDPDEYVRDLFAGKEPLYVPEGMRWVSSLRLPFDDEQEKAEATEKAEDLRRQILSGEISYNAAWEENNQDPGQTGLLAAGYPVWAESQIYLPQFIEAAMALQTPGELSPVGFYDGYLLLLCYREETPPGVVPFESRAESYTAALLEQRKKEAYAQAEAQWMEEARVQIDVEPLIVPQEPREEASQATLPTSAFYVNQATEAPIYAYPEGPLSYFLEENARVEALGNLTFAGDEWAYVRLPADPVAYGYVRLSELAGLSGDTSPLSLVQAWDVIEDAPSPNPVFTLLMEDGTLVYGELYPDIAPNTVGNFISLANGGFYDGLTFHRAIEGFVLQGGDPMGNGTGGPGYAIRGEYRDNGVPNDLLHERGVLSMARTPVPDSAGSQFFFMLEPAPSLDGQYAAFGRILGGLDSLESQILSVPRDANDKPTVDQVIRQIRVETFMTRYPFDTIPQ